MNTVFKIGVLIFGLAGLYLLGRGYYEYLVTPAPELVIINE
jgi:hypothetical protein